MSGSETAPKIPIIICSQVVALFCYMVSHVKSEWMRCAILFATASVCVCWTLQSPMPQTMKFNPAGVKKVDFISLVRMASAVQPTGNFEPRLFGSRRLYRWANPTPKIAFAKNEALNIEMMKLIAIARLSAETAQQETTKQTAVVASGTSVIPTKRCINATSSLSVTRKICFSAKERMLT